MNIMKEIGFVVSDMERGSMYSMMVCNTLTISHCLDKCDHTGSKFEGMWENDRINGEGTSWYPNGNCFHGEWVNGKINGRGVTLRM